MPARLIGVKPTQSRRDKLTTSVVSGALGATVPRRRTYWAAWGSLMVGSDALLIPGIIVIALGVRSSR